MVFIELPLFRKYITFTDEELREAQNELLSNPEAGDLIKGSGGFRKLRVAMKGRGKRGGARVIYFWRMSKSVCYLLLAYPKNIMDDLSPDQVRLLARVVDEEIGDG